MRADITLATPVRRTARVLQLQGMFDVPLEEKLTTSWQAVLPVEERAWHVGLLVGPSGAGKTTIARALWPGRLVEAHTWGDRALVDDFPKGMGIKDIVGLLTAVGLSSPPAWLRPYRTLSNGEAFRASMARALAEQSGLVVVDEFTSVVDRQVAKVASHAVAKAVRRGGRQLVAVTCHYDVLDWLQPDWVYDVATASFAWRTVQPRPTLQLDIRAADRSLWQVFRHHHYLSAEISNTAHCVAGYVDGQPVAFLAYRHFQHPRVRNMKMEHRLVVLPDFQGLSIGARMSEWVAQHLADQGYRYRSVSSHPALISYRDRSPRWQRQARATKLHTSSTRRNQHKDTLDPRRLGLISFEYIPPVAPSRRVR
ncbi:GNAT family N-acetyltransferase [Nonomuraea basaltis]|uniref:GNAT family N-acetyltransferase n=1 Tax=Nonomuraea basaltis TaxID=2495887 RepID=UPI00110C4488|nr:GNAT family N-acetyltransferase [Nonomuraea basaltis]TMR90602.1 GNAT family N-acetyltransferase [Nonomuraea basaltis]